MSNYTLSHRSRRRLKGVHPDLVKVVKRAIELSKIDFLVLEGLRSEKRQAELLKAGATRIMKSRHITGHAVDLGAWVNRRVDWHWPYYHMIAKAMKQAARELKVDLEWGGDWKRFPDGPHFQLSRKRYPARSWQPKVLAA